MIIKGCGLLKKYESMERPVLNNCDMEIGSGEFVALTGPSGTGKTTLLNIISGILKPDKGMVFFDGDDLLKKTEKEKKKFRLENMGFIFQGYYLLPTLNTYDNIVLPSLGAGKDVKKGEVEELLDKLGIGDKIYNYPFQLSGGEQQRVAIGRALLNRPKIIFADEPTGNLDYDNSVKIMEIFKKCAVEMGTSVLFVTHDNDMIRFADKHFKLDKGKIIYEK